MGDGGGGQRQTWTGLVIVVVAGGSGVHLKEGETHVDAHRHASPDSEQREGKRAEPELNNVTILYSRGSWQKATKTNKQTNKERERERESPVNGRKRRKRRWWWRL